KGMAPIGKLRPVREDMMTLIQADDLYRSEHDGIVYRGVISEAEWGTSPRGNDWGKFTLLSRSGREDRNGNLRLTRYVVWVPASQIAEFKEAYPDHDRSQWTDWKEQRKIVPEQRRAVVVHLGKTGSQWSEASGTPRKDRAGNWTMWTDIAVGPERVDFTPPQTMRRKRMPSTQK
ncbi:hypothetical protein, partial [Streptomyces sp. NPDC005407]|uniref:hypothetical protein n=1 Tax=Streptomyces sp. NPDC005407 TaxID=3155340 RepID=UPI0033B56447